MESFIFWFKVFFSLLIISMNWQYYLERSSRKKRKPIYGFIVVSAYHAAIILLFFI